MMMRNSWFNVRGITAGTALLIGILVSSSSGSQVQQLRALPVKFSFVVLGDTRAGDPACDSVYGNLIAAAMERKPAFVVNTGDQIDKPGNKDHWRRFWELSKPVNVPYFLTVGNHDAHVEVAGSEETFKEQGDLPGGKLYYSFVAGKALFIVLDSYLKNEDKRITGAQFAWLEDTLSRSQEKLRFVFIHHPLFPEQGKGKHHGNSLDRYTAERDRLQALFVRYRVSAVFLGHEHLYLRKTRDGIPHVITGGGGAPLYADDLSGGFHHFVFVTVEENTFHAEAVDVQGRVRDRF